MQTQKQIHILSGSSAALLLAILTVPSGYALTPIVKSLLMNLLGALFRKRVFLKESILRYILQIPRV